MNRAIATQVLPDRPKYLRPASGVFSVVHAPQGAAANSASPEGESDAAPTSPVLPFTSHIRTPEKAAVRMEIVEILATCCHGISNADLGATINETPQDVRRIREGSKPLTADHLLRIG